MFSLDVFYLCRWLWCEDTDDGILIIENFYISKFSFYLIIIKPRKGTTKHLFSSVTLHIKVVAFGTLRIHICNSNILIFSSKRDTCVTIELEKWWKVQCPVTYALKILIWVSSFHGYWSDCFLSFKSIQDSVFIFSVCIKIESIAICIPYYLALELIFLK